MTAEDWCEIAVEKLEASPLVNDELESVVSTLCAKVPGSGRGEVVELVVQVYQQLAAEAKVTTDLIPLTLNRCSRLLVRGA